MQALRQRELDSLRMCVGLAETAPPGGAAAADASATSGASAREASSPPLPPAPAPVHAPLPAAQAGHTQLRCADCREPFRLGAADKCLELRCSSGCRALLHVGSRCPAAAGRTALRLGTPRRHVPLQAGMPCLTALAGGAAACDGIMLLARVMPVSAALAPVTSSALSGDAIDTLFDDREAAAAAAARRAAEQKAAAAAAKAALVTPYTPPRSRAHGPRAASRRSSDGAGTSPVASSPLAAVAVLHRATPQASLPRHAVPSTAVVPAPETVADAASSTLEQSPASSAVYAAARLAVLRMRTCDDAVTTSVLVELVASLGGPARVGAVSTSPPRPCHASAVLTAQTVVALAARVGVALADVEHLPPHAAVARVAEPQHAVTLRTLLHGRCAAALLPDAPVARLHVSFLADEPAVPATTPAEDTRGCDDIATTLPSGGDDSNGDCCGASEPLQAAPALSSPAAHEPQLTLPQALSRPARWADGRMLAMRTCELKYFLSAPQFTLSAGLLGPVTAHTDGTRPATALLLLDICTGELHALWAAVAQPAPGASRGVQFSRVPPLATRTHAAPGGVLSCAELRYLLPRVCGAAFAIVTAGVSGAVVVLSAAEVRCLDACLSIMAAGLPMPHAFRNSHAAGCVDGDWETTEEAAAPQECDVTGAWSDTGDADEAVARVARFEEDEALARALQAVDLQEPPHDGAHARAETARPWRALFMH